MNGIPQQPNDSATLGNEPSQGRIDFDKHTKATNPQDLRSRLLRMITENERKRHTEAPTSVVQR